MSDEFLKRLIMLGYSCRACKHVQKEGVENRVYCKYFHMMVDFNHFCKKFEKESLNA